MAVYTDGYWWSNDGLRLHYRDYEGPADKPPLLCLPGLTRNARDFEPLADRLAGRWRVIVVELRGRGESAYAKDPMTYVPLAYLQDIEALLAELKLEKFVAVGTSLGGILTMLLASTGRKRLAGAILNDVGPALEEAGLARIRSYVGRSQSWPTWLHAARALAEANAGTFPGYRLDDWLAMAKRLCRLNASGRIVFDYDMKIAEPFRLPGGETGVDLWPTMDAFADIPTLLLRGERSDLLSADTAAQMQARVPGLICCEVPNVGHAPVLDEPAAVAAIDDLLEKIERRQG